MSIFCDQIFFCLFFHVHFFSIRFSLFLVGSDFHYFFSQWKKSSHNLCHHRLVLHLTTFNNFAEPNQYSLELILAGKPWEIVEDYWKYPFDVDGIAHNLGRVVISDHDHFNIDRDVDSLIHFDCLMEPTQ